MTHSVRAQPAQHGLTLIELMITIVVLTLLLFMGSSLTQAWVDRGNVDDTISALKNTTFQARSAALRNTNNQLSNRAAASVCFDRTNHALQVVRAELNAVDGCNTNTTNTANQNFILQNIPLPKGIQLTVNNADFHCLAFNSAGILVDSTSSVNACSNALNLKIVIEKNNEKAEIQIN